jgi:fatty acid desaturase
MPELAQPVLLEGTLPGPVHEAPIARLDTAWTQFWSRTLNDPRDVVFVNLGLAMTLGIFPVAALLFSQQSFSWAWAPAYWLYIGYFFMDRFILMLHCTSHRPLFNKKFRFLNFYIPWVLGPFIGETPEAYFVHHMGMHHKEGNLWGDLSTTMPYQRDRITHWLHYWARFMFLGLPDLALYHFRKGRTKMLRRLVLGEGSFWAFCGLLAAFVNLRATLVVFVIPVLIIRTLMMAGNWGQHAFIDPEEPSNDFKSSITCINTRYNRRCFNDGYHIIHHLKPSLHYSEMADEFFKNRARYGEQDAIVFEGVDFFEVWLLLMTHQYGRLARAFVRLPGAPARTDDEVIALIKKRMVPFQRPTAIA